jgi:hypothetical protein
MEEPIGAQHSDELEESQQMTGGHCNGVLTVAIPLAAG